MAKITISRIFETTKALATQAGNDLNEFVTFSAQFAEITIRALRNGLTADDNFDCEIKTLKLTQGSVTEVNVGKRRPREIRQRRLLNTAYMLSRPIAWGFTAKGNVYVSAEFTPTPPAGEVVEIEIIILY